MDLTTAMVEDTVFLCQNNEEKKLNEIHMPYETLSLIGVTFEDEFQKYLRQKGKKTRRNCPSKR